MVIAVSVISFALALAGFIYGAIHLLHGKRPLYFKLIISSTACFAFERLSALVNYLTDGYYYVTLAELGVFGALLFLLSSNYGAMNHIVDDGVGTKKYRMMACAAPAVSLIALVYIFCSALSLGTAAACVTVFILSPIVPASYFTLKHLILPNDAVGFLKSVRWCNVFSILFYLSLVVCAITLLKAGEWGSYLSVFPALFSALISVFAVRGEKLWEI